MLQMGMSKLSLKVLLGVFALMLSASVGLSAECKDDPNECTPKNLCEVATQVINDNKVWSEDASAANHIAFVKELGMECGVVEITDPCDLDPSECKVKQLCEKATTGDDGSKSWNADAEAYVALAKEYGLECGVQEVVASTRSEKFADYDDRQICQRAIYKGGWVTSGDGLAFANEARSRGLDCGVAKVIMSKNCENTPAVCPETILCQRAIYKGGWVTSGDGLAFTKEAQRRGLSCGVGEVTANKLSDRFADWDDETICWWSVKNKIKADYSEEAKRRGLDCSVGSDAGVSNSSRESLASYFKNQSLTKRKQIQYALKDLGFYTMSIDGLWGNGTKRAFATYKDKVGVNSYNIPDAVKLLLEMVEVPSTFNTPKKSYSSSSSSKYSKAKSEGWVPLSGEPKLPYDDAKEICTAKAELAYRSYLSGNRSGSGSGDIDCYTYGFNNISCSRSKGGGVSRGILNFLEGRDAKVAAKKQAHAAAKVCMADYGWRYTK